MIAVRPSQPPMSPADCRLVAGVTTVPGEPAPIRWAHGTEPPTGTLRASGVRTPKT